MTHSPPLSALSQKVDRHRRMRSVRSARTGDAYLSGARAGPTDINPYPPRGREANDDWYDGEHENWEQGRADAANGVLSHADIWGSRSSTMPKPEGAMRRAELDEVRRRAEREREWRERDEWGNEP